MNIKEVFEKIEPLLHEIKRGVDRTPICVVVRGLPGSGKTTLARMIATELDCQHMDCDFIHRKGGHYIYDAKRHSESVEFFAESFGGCYPITSDIVLSDVYPYEFCHMAQRGFVVSLEISRTTSIVRNNHNCRVEDIDAMIDAWEPCAHDVKELIFSTEDEVKDGENQA